MKLNHLTFDGTRSTQDLANAVEQCETVTSGVASITLKAHGEMVIMHPMIDGRFAIANRYTAEKLTDAIAVAKSLIGRRARVG